MNLSHEQQRALDAIGRWMHDPDQQVFRLFGFAGTGKSGPITSTIQTPHGPALMRDIGVGDDVFGLNGRPTKVTGVFPQGMRQTYRVTFRDGFSAECSADHLWSVWTPKLRLNKRHPIVLTTQDMLNRGVRCGSGNAKFYIPLCSAVAYKEQALPIDPYLLGVAIGDGTSLGRSPSLILSDDDVGNRVAKALPYGGIMRTDKKLGCRRWRIVYPGKSRNLLAADFRDMGLSVLAKDKFIPTQYLQGSIAQRWELLRGLMDTDGCCKRNRASFSTSSERLANDMCTLVQSLGGIAICHTHDRSQEGKSKEYSINVKTFETPFWVPSKAKNWSLSWKNPPSRAIVSIVPIGIKEHQCISVANEDGLYLTDHFIVTHNTTLAKYVQSNCTLFCAFTGKASYVLRQKGCEAFTIHQLIYHPSERSRQHLAELEAALACAKTPEDVRKIEAEIAFEKKRLSAPAFSLNSDSPIRTADLVVVDEVSMVGGQVANDLMSFGTKILVLGDPAQLPPVYGAGHFTNQQPDFLLTEVHRQALDNPIIRLATRIRNREDVAPDGNMVVPWGSVSPAEAMSFDQILVGRNKTRKATNAKIRDIKGRTTIYPCEGDRVVCLRNDHEIGLLNGATYEVETCIDRPYEHLFMVVCDGAERYAVESHRYHFENKDDPMPWWIRREAQEFDYGYALTVHKAQGSEWDAVIVFDESEVFGHDRYRWAYTAVTRAAKRLKFVVRD